MYQNGNLNTLDFPGANGQNGTFTQITDINNVGQIVGFYRLSDGIGHNFD